MLVRERSSLTARAGSWPRRRGAVAPVLIAAFPALLAAFTLAVQLASLRHRHLELQIAGDAASLSGADALLPVNDLLLFSSAAIPNATRDAIFDSVRNVAVDYAQRNQFISQGVSLNANALNLANGELVIGTMNQPFDPVFDTDITTNAWDLYTPRYNSVQVMVARGGPLAFPFHITGTVGHRVRTFVDRDVIGFKAEGSSHTFSNLTYFNSATPAVPLVPLAVRSEFLTNPPTDAGSWDRQIIHRFGPDSCSIASGAPVCGFGGDGIPEITVRFSGLIADNGQMVAVPSATTVAGATSQITTGITATDLAAYDPVNNTLTLNTGVTNEVTLTRLAPTAGDFAGMVAALTGILGQRRAWMLYDTPTGGTVRVVGFVGARIMRVIDNSPFSVDVVLQPTMLITTTAVTDFTRRSLGPRNVFGINSIFNPYVARVRIAQ